MALRPVTEERRVAHCRRCGETRLGTTRVSEGWTLIGRDRTHVCDDCREPVVERPLDAVIFDMLDEP